MGEGVQSPKVDLGDLQFTEARQAAQVGSLSKFKSVYIYIYIDIKINL